MKQMEEAKQMYIEIIQKDSYYNPAIQFQRVRFNLENIYCSSIGMEYMYLRNPEVIKWWQEQLNKNDNQPNFSVETKKYILSNFSLASRNGEERKLSLKSCLSVFKV